MKDCKLVSDYESGEGDVILSDRFKSESPLLRADILGDWLYCIAKFYDQAVDELGVELAKMAPNDARAAPGERQEGWYWVKCCGDWEPALYSPKGIPSTPWWRNDTPIEESAFEEIGARILKPDDWAEMSATEKLKH